MKIAILSDTHGYHHELEIPYADILIHAGDFLMHDELSELVEFNRFLAHLPHPHKIVVAGNHDGVFQRFPQQARQLLTAAHYLQDESVEIEGIKFYGAPWQPRFFNYAFNLNRGVELREKWSLIPVDTDILITHCPPMGIADCVRGRHVGCEDLREAVLRIKPKYHVFGHIHEGYGIEQIQETHFINASICDVNYFLTNPVVELEYDLRHLPVSCSLEESE